MNILNILKSFSFERDLFTNIETFSLAYNFIQYCEKAGIEVVDIKAKEGGATTGFICEIKDIKGKNTKIVVKQSLENSYHSKKTELNIEMQNADFLNKMQSSRTGRKDDVTIKHSVLDLGKGQACIVSEFIPNLKTLSEYLDENNFLQEMEKHNPEMYEQYFKNIEKSEIEEVLCYTMFGEYPNGFGVMNSWYLMALDVSNFPPKFQSLIGELQNIIINARNIDIRDLTGNNNIKISCEENKVPHPVIIDAGYVRSDRERIIKEALELEEKNRSRESQNPSSSGRGLQPETRVNIENIEDPANVFIKVQPSNTWQLKKAGMKYLLGLNER